MVIKYYVLKIKEDSVVNIKMAVSCAAIFAAVAYVLADAPAHEELEYIESNGSQYIQLFNPHAELDTTDNQTGIACEAKGFFINAGDTAHCFVGCRASSTQRFFFVHISGKYGFGYVDPFTFMPEAVPLGAYVPHDFRTEFRNGSQTMFINGTEVLSAARSTGTPFYAPDVPLYLFAFNNNNVDAQCYAQARCYSLRFYALHGSTSTLMHDYVPVLKDDVACLYDRVGGTYHYPNSGTLAYRRRSVRTAALDHTVDYIESHGQEWIDTGIAGHVGLATEALVAFTDVPTEGCLLGSYNSDSYFSGIYQHCDLIKYTSGSFTLGTGPTASVTPSAPIAATAGDYYTVQTGIFRDRLGVIVGDDRVYLNEYTRTGAGNDVNLAVFAEKQNNGTAALPVKAKISSLKIWSRYDNSLCTPQRLERDFTPALAVNGEYGLYDAVTGLVYLNCSGEGAFTSGAARPTFHLTVEAPEGVTITRSPVSGDGLEPDHYDAETTVLLTAPAQDGSGRPFAGWLYNGAWSSETTNSVLMTAAKTITALYQGAWRIVSQAGAQAEITDGNWVVNVNNGVIQSVTAGIGRLDLTTVEADCGLAVTMIRDQPSWSVGKENVHEVIAPAITNIGWLAFGGNDTTGYFTHLRKVVLSEGLSHVGRAAFHKSEALESLTPSPSEILSVIPMTSNEAYMFDYCPKLTNDLVIVRKDDFTVPHNWLAASGFRSVDMSGCKGTVTFDLTPSSEPLSPNCSRAFCAMPNLERVILPPKMTAWPRCLLSNNGETCPNLKGIYFSGTVPPPETAHFIYGYTDFAVPLYASKYLNPNLVTDFALRTEYEPQEEVPAKVIGAFEAKTVNWDEYNTASQSGDKFTKLWFVDWRSPLENRGLKVIFY